uniref:SFR19-like C-terminal domain-containing protein n=1 Tax=Gadus morhua TaxID=8049 RepID=A0A8C5A0M5_GADMO
LPEEGDHQGRVQGDSQESRGEGHRSGEVNSSKVANLVKAYVDKYKHEAKKKNTREPMHPSQTGCSGPPRRPRQPRGPGRGGGGAGGPVPF